MRTPSPHLPSPRPPCLRTLHMLFLAGSLLVACAHFGAYVTGMDIDYNIIHAKGTCNEAATRRMSYNSTCIKDMHDCLNTCHSSFLNVISS